MRRRSLKRRRKGPSAAPSRANARAPSSAPARFRAKFAAEVGAKRTPLARHLEGVKLGAAELRDILRGERPELSPYASLDLSAEVPQELAEDAGFSRPVLKDDGEIFYDYWLWFFRHARKRAVQQRKEAAD